MPIRLDKRKDICNNVFIDKMRARDFFPLDVKLILPYLMAAIVGFSGKKDDIMDYLADMDEEKEYPILFGFPDIFAGAQKYTIFTNMGRIIRIEPKAEKPLTYSKYPVELSDDSIDILQMAWMNSMNISELDLEKIENYIIHCTFELQEKKLLEYKFQTIQKFILGATIVKMPKSQINRLRYSLPQKTAIVKKRQSAEPDRDKLAKLLSKLNI